MMAANFDPRITPARPDLAAAHLRGKVEAGRFVEGTEQEVIVGLAPLRKDPQHDATLVTEALCGEVVSLPMHAYLDETVQDRIVEAVADSLRAVGLPAA